MAVMVKKVGGVVHDDRGAGATVGTVVEVVTITMSFVLFFVVIAFVIIAALFVFSVQV